MPGCVLHRQLIPKRVASMKSMFRGSSKLTVARAACLAIGLLAAGCASDPRPVVLGVAPTLPAMNDYCSIAQKEIATARVPARNVLMNDYASFSRATPSVKPLETLQFVDYSDAQHTKPRMVSSSCTAPTASVPSTAPPRPVKRRPALDSIAARSTP